MLRSKKKKMNIYKHDVILSKCENKKVLHIGASDFPFHKDRARRKILLHQKIEKVAKSVVGLDVNRGAISDLKKFDINNIYFGDIDKAEFDNEILEKEYDVIVFGDVIEHLDNPGNALKNIKKLMSQDTILVLTTPNVWGIFNLKNIFFKKEIVHPDHTFWPSKRTMDNLIKRQGLKIHKFSYLLTGSFKDSVTLKGRVFRSLVLRRVDRFRGVLYYEIKID